MRKGKIKKFLGEVLSKLATKLLVPSEAKEQGVTRKEKIEEMIRRDDKKERLKRLNERYWKKAKVEGLTSEQWTQITKDNEFHYAEHPRFIRKYLDEKRRILNQHTLSAQEEFDRDMTREDYTPAKIREKKKWWQS
jgi:hypothetical protein